MIVGRVGSLAKVQQTSKRLTEDRRALREVEKYALDLYSLSYTLHLTRHTSYHITCHISDHTAGQQVSRGPSSTTRHHLLYHWWSPYYWLKNTALEDVFHFAGKYHTLTSQTAFPQQKCCQTKLHRWHYKFPPAFVPPQSVQWPWGRWVDPRNPSLKISVDFLALCKSFHVSVLIKYEPLWKLTSNSIGQ